MNFFAWLFRRKPKKVSLGLALGSGGAKGFAELGALTAFEENGLSFDYIAGSSIGSIIGAFYANGYTSRDISELLKKIDFGGLIKNIMLKGDTGVIKNTIEGLIGSISIEELKKPFRVVATELDSGDETVFEKGNVSDALVASSSYPPFIKPYIIDGKRYVDGAFSNSVPADVVKKLGADIVVGIDLSSHQSKQGGLMKLFPTYKGKTDTPWEKGEKFSDVYIHPDLTEFKPTSFSEKAEMFEIGYRSAIEKIPEIKGKIANFYKKKKK